MCHYYPDHIKTYIKDVWYGHSSLAYQDIYDRLKTLDEQYLVLKREYKEAMDAQQNDIWSTLQDHISSSLRDQIKDYVEICFFLLSSKIESSRLSKRSY